MVRAIHNWSETQQAADSQRLAHQHLPRLRRQLGGWRQATNFPVLSSGAEVLDRLLPAGGLRRGSLVEWLGGAADMLDARGSGATLLALAAAAQAQAEGGVVAIVDRQRQFYPPAAAAWGIDLSATLIVHPNNSRDELWAIDQIARASEITAVLAWPEKLDRLVLRRLQLAVETSGTLGLLVRPATAAREATAADVRLQVRPVPASASENRGATDGLPGSASNWQLQVDLLRSRGGFARGSVVLEVNATTGKIDEARAGHLAAELAAPAVG